MYPPEDTSALGQPEHELEPGHEHEHGHEHQQQQHQQHQQQQHEDEAIEADVRAVSLPTVPCASPSKANLRASSYSCSATPATTNRCVPPSASLPHGIRRC